MWVQDFSNLESDNEEFSRIVTTTICLRKKPSLILLISFYNRCHFYDDYVTYS